MPRVGDRWESMGDARAACETAVMDAAPRWILVTAWTLAAVLAGLGAAVALATMTPLPLVLALGLAVPLIVVRRRPAG
ncbi:hypothetical protein [Microbacterium sp. RU33B]|uniref:hypothetical protein n=1 Tax=Microbacterium sp. RU33B TaxID=1907390 RepID=UPI000963B5E1|nr:hypothetical protein [Microbacterium sp. RU33B]SIT71120.1 hypothetical protein SAMN05880545_0806 [Microbacterium sp. RU33B]